MGMGDEESFGEVGEGELSSGMRVVDEGRDGICSLYILYTLR
jgi:hypothetical protein